MTSMTLRKNWWNCSRKELIANECYYNRKACELIFLTRSEHIRLHMKNISDETRRKLSETAKNISDETRKKLSEAAKCKTGEKNPFFGKHHSDETKRKMSEAAKRREAKKRRLAKEA